MLDFNKVYLDKNDLRRVLDCDGKITNKNYKVQISNEKLLEAYKYMILSRQQDVYMTQLQRQGRMLTFAPNFGEEALQVAVSSNIEKGDWFAPAFRSNAIMLHLGVPLKNQLLYWNGSEKGSKMPKGVNVLPINIPIATQFSHAAGIAYAMKYKREKHIAISFVGDGGTAEGEFYEALNIASIHKLPVLFCINNNKWAISTPNKLESGSITLASKAIAAGIPSLRVDGNDFFASYDAAKEAMKYVRSGKGPVLIEFVTWREGPHTTSDNPRIYRTEAAEKKAAKWEPFNRIETYMMDKNLLTPKQKQKLWDDALEQVKKVFNESQKEMDASIDDVFDYTYETNTPNLENQKAEAQNFFGGSK